MISGVEIYGVVNRLITDYGTNDPFQLIHDLNITLKYSNDLKKLMGMYTYLWNTPIIIINGSLDESIAPVVAAHELGHDRLHRDIAGNNSLQEFSLFRNIRTEYEANAFAAHCLMNCEETLDILHDVGDCETASKILRVPIELLTIKLQEMKKLGFHLPDISLPTLMTY